MQFRCIQHTLISDWGTIADDRFLQPKNRFFAVDWYTLTYNLHILIYEKLNLCKCYINLVLFRSWLYVMSELWLGIIDSATCDDSQPGFEVYLQVFEEWSLKLQWPLYVYFSFTWVHGTWFRVRKNFRSFIIFPKY